MRLTCLLSLLEGIELVFLFVEELPVKSLALALELVGIVSLLQLHVLEVKDVNEDQQLLAVDTQILFNLVHSVALR